jgi:hypothetical protein
VHAVFFSDSQNVSDLIDTNSKSSRIYKQKRREIARLWESRSMKLRVCCGVLVVVLTFFACAISAMADATATLTGRVVDPKGLVVVDARVEAVNVDTGVHYPGQSNSEGYYNIVALPPGTYHVIVEKPGFKTIDKTDVILHVEDVLALNINLEIGSVSETVTVNGTTTNESPAVSLTVTRDFVENMPLNGRSLEDLIALAPGAVTSNSGTGLYSINGQHENSNYYALDGVSANVNPTSGNGDYQGLAGTLPSTTALGTTQSLISVDALQEFKIQTSGYSAEYGRQPGGQVELTSRSGSNDFHGSLFDYFRNTVMDANDWFLNQMGTPRLPEHQNDFGGAVGGPITIPHFYDGTGKTFFFVSYEGLRLEQPQFLGVRNVPTVALRQFAAPGVQPFLDAFPLPNGAPNGDQCALPQTFSCTAKYSSGTVSKSSIDATSVRLDHSIGQKIHLFTRYFTTPSHLRQPGYGSYSTSSSNADSWTVGATVALKPSVVNELRLNYTQATDSRNSVLTTVGGGVPYPMDIVLPPQFVPHGSAFRNSIDFFVPGLALTGLSSSSPSYEKESNAQHQFNVLDGLSLVRGGHALKFGFDYRRLTPLWDQIPYSTVIAFESLASIQDGVPDFAFVSAAHKVYPTFQNLSLYAQDQWKLTSRLTIDYGVRWELNPPPGAADGLYPPALTTANLAVATLAPVGTPQYQTIYDNFAPRFGFAYELSTAPTHPVVVRGGYGIFYDTGQAEGAAGYLGPPFEATRIINGLTLPASPAALSPPSLNLSLTPPYGAINGISDPHLRLPYTQEWNLTIDQGIGSRDTLSLSYVGNVGRRLLTSEIYGVPGVPGSVFGNPNFTQLQLETNAASSNYNALQVQNRGFVAPGLQAIASYTWSHALDNASTDNGVAFGAPSILVHGNSDNDIRQVFNIALAYDIPTTGRKGIVRELTRGWSIQDRFTVQSGYPIDAAFGFFVLGVANGPNAIGRPDLVPGVPIYLHNVPGVLGGWELNPDAFTGFVGDGRIPAGTIPVDTNGNPLRAGTLGRNFLHGPNFWAMNTALQRNFSLHDRLQLIFRAEAFNIFNHPNSGNIDSFLYDSTFGQSTSTPTVGTNNSLYGMGAARSLQLMLRLQF